MTKLDNDASRLPTVMCGSLASRLDNESFQKGVDWLLTKIDNDASRPTVMCNSLASRLDNESFRKGVDRLLTKLDASRLPTVMCDSLASRLDNASFRENVELLVNAGFDKNKLQTLLGDGVIVAKLQSILPNLIKVGPRVSRKRAREM